MEESQAHGRVVRGPRDDPNLTDEELVQRRIAWFRAYTAQQSVRCSPGATLYTCPCCGHATLDARGDYEICDECGWEDDGQDDHDSAVVRGGPNGSLSLDAARVEFEARGGIRGAHQPPQSSR
jgi:hypothetical protein